MKKLKSRKLSNRISEFIFFHAFYVATAMILSQCTELCYGEETTQKTVTEKYPVTICSLTADLKYNKKQGIKIVELQQTSLSASKGYDQLYGTKHHIAKRYCRILSQFALPVWFVKKDVYGNGFKNEFSKRSWTPLTNLKKLTTNPEFLKATSLPVYDPYNISHYQGILFAKPRSVHTIKGFEKIYPGIIIVDLPTFPYWIDKYEMNTLFTKNQELAKVRPVWKAYPKKYLKLLAQKIDNDIPGNIVVIKPRKAFKGRGVIIAEKKNLDEILQRILINPINLRRNQDTSYNYWARDPCKTFLVEEFIQSDPIQVPDFNNGIFDATMRVVFFLIYDQQETRIEFVEGYWKLPKMPLSGKGDLNDKHKSFGSSPYFAKVEPDVNREVEKQLRRSMRLLYQEIQSK